MESQVLTVDGLCVRRGNRTVLHDVSFALEAGEIVTVIGANGAGKSSLLEAVLGFLPAEAGRIRHHGVEIGSLPKRAQVFSYMPDEAEPPAEVSVQTLLEHAVRYGRAPNATAEDLKQRLGLSALMGARAEELSRGEKRRVSLFGALCSNRPVLVLDEPLGAFDPLQLLDVLAVLNDRARAGAALLISVHQMSDAEKIASRVLLLHEGRVLAFASLAHLRSRMDRPQASLEEIFLILLREAHAPS
jgi:ABC-2 type transport system ATP-binding protein